MDHDHSPIRHSGGRGGSLTSMNWRQIYRVILLHLLVHGLVQCEEDGMRHPPTTSLEEISTCNIHPDDTTPLSLKALDLSPGALLHSFTKPLSFVSQSFCEKRNGILRTLSKSEYSEFFFITTGGEGLAVAKSLTPLVGKNLSLALREDFEGGNGSLIRPVHIWVSDPNLSHSKYSKIKGTIRENEDPHTLVQFMTHTEEDERTKKSQYTKAKMGDPTTLSKALSRLLPQNVSPSNLILRNLNEEESVPFTISFDNNSENNDAAESINNIEIRTSSWIDYEQTPSFSLTFSKQEDSERSASLHSLLNFTVEVQNVNDNLPVFKTSDTVWRFPANARRYMVIGTALANDADGDEIVYEFLGGKKVAGSGCCVIVPKTGEIMLVENPFVPTHITIVAREKDAPSRRSLKPMTIALIPDDEMNNEIMTSLSSRRMSGVDYFLDYMKHGGDALVRQKRHVTRAVRPTKRTESTEADGQPAGKVVFKLEKESEHEKFKIRDENPWVTVEPNGAVRVKKRWDYEELGREKTIDFWVIISNVRAEKWKSAVPYTDNQRVIIRVKDVNDEPPYFINRPLPVQAVVKLNAAPNSPVFTLQAKDPNTDHNLHYFLVR